MNWNVVFGLLAAACGMGFIGSLSCAAASGVDPDDGAGKYLILAGVFAIFGAALAGLAA